MRKRRVHRQFCQIPKQNEKKSHSKSTEAITLACGCARLEIEDINRTE